MQKGLRSRLRNTNYFMTDEEFLIQVNRTMPDKLIEYIFGWKNKKMSPYNTSYYNDINSEQSKNYIKKPGFSRPKYLNIPKNYDGFINDDIYVIKKNKLIFPLFYYKLL